MRGFWRRWRGAMAALPILVASAHAAQVRDLRLWRAPDHTRLVLDLSAPARYTLFELDEPYRLVIDLADTALLASYEDLELDNTPIARVRSGVFEGEDLRLVLDLHAAVRARSFALAATERAADRVVIDLYDEVAGDAESPDVKNAEKNAGKNAVKSAGKNADEGADKGARKTAGKSARGAPRRDIVVAIDAGHGGEDPGALGHGRLREKQVVLEIARELHRLFEGDAGFSPTLIRRGDYYVSLKGRRDLARQRQADLLVSIHADAFRDRRARGASVYALSTRGATSTTASYLAQRENAADLLGGVRLADMEDALAMTLADLSMTAALDSSLNVGASVLDEIGDFARLHKTQVEQAGFAVLKSGLPSILVETGFISNPAEAEKLATASYRRRMARAIHRGIVRWFREHPPTGSLLAYEREQGEREYTIVRGDTLSAIALRFNTSVAQLKRHNGLNDNRIAVGQTLRIPAN